MSRSQLKYWPIFHNFDKEFMAKIKMVMVYGDYAQKALIVLKDDSVYVVGTDCVKFSEGIYNSLWKPAKVDELSNKGVKSFVWGREYGVAALTDKGEVYCWGRKETDDQRTKDAARPRLIGGCFYEQSIVQISCCDSRLFALTEQGQVFNHCGWYTYIMLRSLCPATRWIGPVKYIACTRSHVMIVNTSGEFSICGGLLDKGGYFIKKGCQVEGCPNDHAFMRPFLSKIVIVKIACGHSHTLFLSESGDVFGLGENSLGQLGTGSTTTPANIVQVTPTEMGKVADVAAILSDHISAALTCTGQVFVWGLSRGQIVCKPTLTPFSTLHEVLAAYAHPNVMYSPLILRDEEKEEENEEGETDVIDSLWEAFDDPSNSDFVIKVEGKTIHVHKSVLGIRSVYFQAMFKGQWTENNQSIFEHNDFPYDVYKSFLKYLYTGEIDVQDEELMELLALANAYCELQLKRRCAQILGRDIEVSNVSHFYDIAVTHGSTELEDLCMEFASNHMSVIALSPQFSELSSERAKAFMIKAAAKGTF